MDNTQKLIELFKEFPGIGPRQAKRFVYFLLNRNPSYANDLAKLISDVRSTVHSCDTCFRFFPNATTTTCPICRDSNRDSNLLMIVSHDVDFENIEKTRFYNGYYFILGGTVPILEKTPEKRIRQKDLISQVEKKTKNGLEEIIIALNYNPEGENTLSYLSQILKPPADKNNIKISTLGRGLSTGTELEYSDSDTIKNALKNRQ
ncbi:MAG: toprim domain-containing protein [Minisyncoccia bacterium]